MKECSKFVSIEIDRFNFLIPSEDVVSSVYCNDETYFQDGKLIYKNYKIPFFDFYNDFRKINNSSEMELSKLKRIALVIKNTCLFDDESYFAIITTKACSVVNINYKDFSLFSENYVEDLRKTGYIACFFGKSCVSYLVNIEKIIKKIK